MRKKKTQSIVMNEKEKDRLSESLAKEASLNEIQQHILRYQLMEEPSKRQTALDIGEIFDKHEATVLRQKKIILDKLKETKFTSSKLKKITSKILLEEEQKKGAIVTTMGKNELDELSQNLAKQVEDFIMEVGNTPRQIYILRNHIFTFYPESSRSIATKFEETHNYILIEVRQLLRKISEFLSGEPSMDKDQIFREVINRMRNEESFFFVSNNEINWQTENLIRQAGLNEIEAYILRYRFLEKPNKRQTKSDIAKKFGKKTGPAISHWEGSMLKKISETEFTSPELKEIAERINQAIKQKKRPVPIINTEKFAKELDNLPLEWKENEIYQHILKYRLLIDPENRKTQTEIANMLNVSRSAIKKREQTILKILQERGLVSFE